MQRCLPCCNPSQAKQIACVLRQQQPRQAKRNTLLLTSLSPSLSASRPEIGSLIISEQNATGPQGESRGRGEGEEQAADEVVEAATANDALQHVDVCVCVTAQFPLCPLSLSLSLLSLLCLACFLPLLLPYPLHLGRKCKPFSVFTFNQAQLEQQREGRGGGVMGSQTGYASLHAHVQVPSDQLHRQRPLPAVSMSPVMDSACANWRISLETSLHFTVK